MAVLQFPCPHCSLKLRARDRTVAGTTIVCPDCGKELLIEEEGNGNLIARPHEVVSPLSSPAPAADPRNQFLPAKKPNRHPPIWLYGGAGIVVLVAILFVGFLISGQKPAAINQTGNGPETAAERSNGAEERPQEGPVAAAADLAGQKLFQEPREIMQRYLDATGRFPAPVTDGPEDPNRRFSWIARLEAFRDPGRLEPLWDHPWDDPLNEHFVRRSLPHWINPAVNPKVSPNKFPATHFVGIAGIGQDAPNLLRSHERAGIFGNNGTASLDDLGDGASNVWMIAGVQREIGSWAAGGRATIRPWTKGPIIGGPDGFGTGNAESMPILMADGSVRTISADTDPAVLSKLAVVRSHRPSEVTEPRQVAGSPNGAATDDSQMPVFQIDPLRAPKPPQAELAELLASLQKELQEEEKQPEINVEKQLSQKLLLFDQPQSLSVKALLDQLQEMSAVPIEIDPNSLGPAADRLDDRIRISLIEPTLKQLLEKILYRAKLGYRIEKGKIVITPDPLPPKLDDE